MQVAESAFAAFREQRALAVRGKVRDLRAVLGFLHQGADRNAQQHVVGAAAVLVRAAALLAVLGAVDAREAIVDQRVDVAVGNRPDAAAAPAVAARGPATRHEFLAPERGAAVPALAGVDFDFRFVDEFHRCGFPSAEKKKPYRLR